MFVDLAGSERLKDHDQNRRETAKINKSLFCLGKVIASLSTSHHAVHIAYRDSVLTKLLKDGLSGHALTLMITCCSPCNIHQEETLNTLLYAQKAKGIVYDASLEGTAAHPRTERAVLREEIKHLRKENTDLHHRLKLDMDRQMSHSFEAMTCDYRTTQRTSHPSLSQYREATLNNMDDPPPPPPPLPTIDGTGSGVLTTAASDNVLREIEALKAKMRRLERQFRERPIDVGASSNPPAFVRSGSCTMGRDARDDGIIVMHPDVSRLMF